MNIWFAAVMLGFFGVVAYIVTLYFDNVQENNKQFHEEELERIRTGKK